MFNEFKKFAFKGNIVDMAVGVIIGGAFTGIVTSLVNDILTPILGLIFKSDFKELFVLLKSPDGIFFPSNVFTTIQDAQEAGFITFNYGSFITAIINFIIIALCMFFIVKAIARSTGFISKKKNKNAPKEEPAPTTKTCPYCLSEIAIKATRCPHCTSQLEDSASVEA